MIRYLAIMLIFAALSAQTVRIGSKTFPESRLLAEMMAQLLEANGFEVERKFYLGGTLICFEALRNGEIDLYPEYTGTGINAILKTELVGVTADSAFRYVQRVFSDTYSLAWLPPFGFNNTYALAVRSDFPADSISQLRSQIHELRLGFSHEFLNRSDGFTALMRHYDLRPPTPTGFEHSLSFIALANQQVDIIEAYSTEGNIRKYGLKLLVDDRSFFPPYYAAPLLNESLVEFDRIKAALAPLNGLISDSVMQSLNLKVEVDGTPIALVAQQFLSERQLIDGASDMEWSRFEHVLIKLWEHCLLTFGGTFIAILLGGVIGIRLGMHPRAAALVLNTSNVIQTIPSLALLGLMIPLFGVGFIPALIAIVLYGLMPILRNTITGVRGLSPHLEEAGLALGMTDAQLLWQIRVPLAVPIIMAGIRTATVWNVGTATIAAFIGAGGLGELILTGINLNDYRLIAYGAIPAALLALMTDAMLHWIEERLKPGRRRKRVESTDPS